MALKFSLNFVYLKQMCGLKFYFKHFRRRIFVKAALREKLSFLGFGGGCN